jgi:hypothetical protein
MTKVEVTRTTRAAIDAVIARERNREPPNRPRGRFADGMSERSEAMNLSAEAQLGRLMRSTPTGARQAGLLLAEPAGSAQRDEANPWIFLLEVSHGAPGDRFSLHGPALG